MAVKKGGIAHEKYKSDQSCMLYGHEEVIQHFKMARKEEGLALKAADKGLHAVYDVGAASLLIHPMVA